MPPGPVLAGLLACGAFVALIGVFRALRGLDETISSLLLSDIAIALFNHVVEEPLRDPAGSSGRPRAPAGWSARPGARGGSASGVA